MPGGLRISADIQNRILPMRICDNTLAFAKEGAVERKEKGMREFWTTVGAMVVGYLMYLGIKAISKK